MLKLGKNSKAQYETLHEDLRRIIDRVLEISPVDFGISEGHRSPETQFEYFKRGRELVDGEWRIVDRSKVITSVDGYDKLGKHNHYPSKAFDFYIWVPGKKGLMYNDLHLCFLAGLFIAAAKELKEQGIINSEIRWGGNWDGDGEIVYDHTLKDLPHVEIK